MSNEIVWLQIASIDVPAPAKFYGDLSGWPTVTDEKRSYTMTAPDGLRPGAGFSPVDEERGTAEGSSLVYVNVEDMDAAIARVSELGSPILVEKYQAPTAGWMAVFGDPGGNRIAAMQRLPQE